MRTFYRLIQGDALEVLPSLERKGVDFTITSPPFRTAHRYGRNSRNDNQDPAQYYEWFARALSLIGRVTRHCSFIFNSSVRAKEIFRRFDPERMLMWFKTASKFSYRFEPIFVFNHGSDIKINGRIWRDVFAFAPLHKQRVPDENPLGLYEMLIKMVTEEGDIILDPFAGSGTTMEACQNLGRSCICVDIDKTCFDAIQNRCFGRQFLNRKVDYKFEVFNGGF